MTALESAINHDALAEKITWLQPQDVLAKQVILKQAQKLKTTDQPVQARIIKPKLEQKTLPVKELKTKLKSSQANTKTQTLVKSSPKPTFESTLKPTVKPNLNPNHKIVVKATARPKQAGREPAVKIISKTVTPDLAKRTKQVMPGQKVQKTQKTQETQTKVVKTSDITKITDNKQLGITNKEVPSVIVDIKKEREDNATIYPAILAPSNLTNVSANVQFNDELFEQNDTTHSIDIEGIGQEAYLADDLLSLGRQEIGINEYIDAQQTSEPEIIELFHEVQQRISELEPIQVPEVGQLLEELVTILAEPEIQLGSEEPENITESQAETIEEKLEVVVTEIFQTLGIEASEPQIRRIVHLLMEHKATFSELKQQELSERGTHEILSHLFGLAHGIKQVLEPLHAILGRIVLLANSKPVRVSQSA